MFRALKEVIKPSKNLGTTITEFYYPRQGFGMIPKALAEEVTRYGGTIHTDTTLAKLTPLNSGFEVIVQPKNGQNITLQADNIVSTIPLNFLLEALPAELGSREILQNFSLDYRDIICLFIALKRKQVSQDSWTYFPRKDLIFGRTHEPKNWSPEMVPDDNFTSLAVEIFASKGEEIWQMADEQILDRVVAQMTEIGWVSKADIHNAWVLRVPYAYPVYRVNYESKLQYVKQFLAQWPALHLVGRTGSFHYLNSDGVIEDVFRFMNRVFSEQTKINDLTFDKGRWV